MSITNIKINSLRTEYDFLRPCTDTSLISLDNPQLATQLNNQITLEGALDCLSRIYAHWWKREIKIPVYTNSLSGTNNYVIYTNSLSNSEKTYQETWQLANSVLISSSGVVSLKDPKSYSATYRWHKNGNGVWLLSFVSGTDPLSVWGQYLKSGRSSTIYYNSEEISIKPQEYDGDSYEYRVCIQPKSGGSLFTVSSKITSYNTTTDYVFSFKRNTYPDSRTSRQYTYTYLGIPFENARGN